MGPGTSTTDQYAGGITSFTPTALDGGEFNVGGGVGNGDIRQEAGAESTGGTVAVDFGVSMPGFQNLLIKSIFDHVSSYGLQNL